MKTIVSAEVVKTTFFFFILLYADHIFLVYNELTFINIANGYFMEIWIYLDANFTMEMKIGRK